ncbi:22766_t:CDS:2 [Cetraspora pellucida]|uniref:22766_t:CDS:1 n=1 Tax=Cetraspora pellucida TaxID=1433469 RepID=A0A9N9D5P5_9GLOM|nr:22766_t:CDS:2 [Cetraspora pellucida]
MVQKLKLKFCKKHHDERNLEKTTDKQVHELRYYEWMKTKLEKGDIQQFDYSEFGDINQIGKGSHSIVFSAECRGIKIALKKFTRHENKILVNELKQHITVNCHENIIKLLGITTGFIVFNSLKKASLYYRVRRVKSYDEVIEIAEQIVFGIQHLHDNKIVHRNLVSIISSNDCPSRKSPIRFTHKKHPKNILINNNKILISGFGSTWKFDDSLMSLFEQRMTYEYSDPQIFIKAQFIPSTKSDIYSLGVILWELTSGFRPFSKVSNKLALAHLISNGKRETTVPGTPSSYAKLYRKCWNINPKKRPELKEILLKIQQSKEMTETIKNHIS